MRETALAALMGLKPYVVRAGRWIDAYDGRVSEVVGLIMMTASIWIGTETPPILWTFGLVLMVAGMNQVRIEKLEERVERSNQSTGGTA